MHPCSEIPSIKAPEDKDCLDLLTSTFTFVHRIGDIETASQSLVFKLSQNNQHIAVKVIPLKQEESALKDIKIGCILNEISDATPVFVKTFGWLKCNQMPPLWIKGLDLKKDVPKSFLFKKGTKSYIFQTMAFSAETWGNDKIHLDLEEYRTMLFLLIHGLWLAKTRYGFEHRDIHSGQVLFEVCKPNTLIVISVENSSYTLVCQRFVPKLIDFGLSKTISSEESEESNYSSSDPDSSEDDEMFEKKDRKFGGDQDLLDLFSIFEQRMKKDGLVPFQPKSTSQNHRDLLLKDPIFEVLRKNSKNTSLVKSGFCDVCSSVAKMEWENRGIRFCNETCANHWNEIKLFL